MKNFITAMLGSLVALIVFATGVVLLFIGFVATLVAVGQSKKAPAVADGSYLVLDLSTNITDAPPPFDLGDLDNGKSDTLQLRVITRTLRHAASDSKIKGLLLLGNLSPDGLGTGYAALKEVRAAVADFHAKGNKPVVAFMDYATTKDFYLASAASEVAMNPFGELIMPGLASEPMFFGDAFQKYGIGIQVTRVGKYKSYVETFTRDSMSPENKEQVQVLLDDIWGSLLHDIAKSRGGLQPVDIQQVVDREGLIKPSVALKAKLVDRLAYRDEIIDQLKKETGVTDATESFRQIDFATYAKSTHTVSLRGGPNFAVVYAEGDIVEGEGANTDVGGARFAREIRELREDNDVKAIVLRVNSPGGSVTASETIQRELRLAAKRKPLVVSMGSYAASGGYWISAYGQRIFAEPTTITGSIGVFGILPNVQKLANDHGVTFDSVKTGKFADGLLTVARPRTVDELAVFQRSVDWAYSQFLTKVAEGRHMSVDRVNDIAQGRVWSGAEAVKIGLADDLGGLDDAVAYAAKLVGLPTHPKLTEYPRSRSLSEAVAEALGRFAPSGLHLQSGSLLGQAASRVEEEVKMLNRLNDPTGLYARLPDLAIH